MKILLFLSILFISFLSIQNISAEDFQEQYFYNIYEKYRSIPENLILMKHTHVIEQLNLINSINEKVQVEEVGKSVEQRSINLVTFGEGPVKVLLWSQMHGDEPTATAALLAIFKYFAINFETPFVQQIFNRISIYALVMLNPDGAQRFQRRNAYDIDINRDAAVLQTPEGQILKMMKDRIQPDYGFNLHDMGGRETVEGSDNLLKIALMAPPFNNKNEDNSTRIKAKKLAVHIRNTLDKYIKGHVAKYKADYMPRAFGDAMQNWGVSTVLVETGRYTGDESFFLEKMNFIALLSAFNSMADNSIEKINANDYDNIPLEGSKVFDIVLRNVFIVNGSPVKPFYGDIAINIDYALNVDKIDTIGIIKDIGDLSIYKGKLNIQNENYIVTPGFINSNKENVENKHELYKKGITTNLLKIESHEKNFVNQSKIAVTDIPELTSKAAGNYNLKNIGVIKRNEKADVLIFNQSEKDTLNLKNLKYVIKNGNITEFTR